MAKGKGSSSKGSSGKSAGPVRDQRPLCYRRARQAQPEHHGEGVEVAATSRLWRHEGATTPSHDRRRSLTSTAVAFYSRRPDGLLFGRPIGFGRSSERHAPIGRATSRPPSS